MTTSTGTKHTNYACVDHPVLEPDAWHRVIYARPVDEGNSAALVCRFACPVRKACPFTEGTETVAGTGWYDQRGLFIRPDDDEIELGQAAVYVGMRVNPLRYLLQRKGITPTKQFRYLSFYPLKEIQKIAYQRGPEHGTIARLKIHQLLGEFNCTYCNSVLVSV
jgi:hypothetical protein